MSNEWDCGDYFDFWAIIRFYSPEDGGPSRPVNGARWSFVYAESMKGEGNYDIWPYFVDDHDVSLPDLAPLPHGVGLRAKMWILNGELRESIHRNRISVGTKFFCAEGCHMLAVGEIAAIGPLLSPQ